MKNKKYALLAALCLFLIFGIGKSSITEASIAPEATPSPTPALRSYTETKPMPEELAYWVLFKEIQTLKERDTQNLAANDETFFKKSFYEDRLGLAAAQFASMDTIAADCLAQLQPVEQRARQVINEYRAPYPNGKLNKIQPAPPKNDGIYSISASKTIETPPPVPAELIQLQNQKKQIILNAKERLRQAFGTNGFAAFETSIHNNAAKVLSPIDFRSNRLPPLPTPTPTPTPTPGN
jgi:hypothetical protein